jgi:hypothetical protein
MNEKPKKILHNRAQCMECKSIVESEHRHDFRTCSCGAMSVDGGRAYIRRVARDTNRVIELTEYEE